MSARPEGTEAPAEPRKFVEGGFTYSVATDEKPVSASVAEGGRLYQRTGTYDERTVAIWNGRPIRDSLTLARQGFELADDATAVTDFFDEDELKAVYYGEVERLVKSRTGARRALIFDHTIRTGDEAKRLREPVRIVHNDYTEWSGPQRVRDLLPDEAAALLEKRVAVVQVWRPIGATVERDPLAICDARTIAAGDLIAAERRHIDRVGEIYHIAFNPAHRWHYFPHMTRDEAMVFTCYDSETDGRARFTAHASFEDPTSPPDAPPRESIEVRALAFF